MENHYLICPNDFRRGSIGRRKSLNQFLHLPRVLHKWTNTVITNGLKWRRKDGIALLKPLVLGWLDFESFGSKINSQTHSVFEKIPSNSLSKQTSMSWAYVWTSLYEKLPLESSLREPRVRFINNESPYENEEAEKALYIDLLLSLRKDLVEHSKFLDAVLEKNQIPTPGKFRDTKIIAFFKSLLYCALCGRKFGEKCWSALKQKYYTVKRVWDHCHYLAASTFPAYACNLRAVLCQVKRMRITDVRTDEWTHPLKK